MPRGLPGVELDGVHKGIDFLWNANLGYRFTIGKRVVVIEELGIVTGAPPVCY